MEDQNTPPRFRVMMSGEAREQFRSIVRRTVYSDTASIVLAVMKELNARPERDPSELGEPMFFLRQIRLHVRRAALSPLYLEFGIMEQQPTVIIRRVFQLNELA